MDLKPTLIKLLFNSLHGAILFFAFFAVFSAANIVAVVFFTEEKSWFEMSWELVTGGSFGALAGLLFYLLIGGIGFVAGPLIYGSLGLLSLIIGGTLTGLGFGTIANAFRHPDNLNYINPGFSLVQSLEQLVDLRSPIFSIKRCHGLSLIKLPNKSGSNFNARVSEA